MSLFLALLIMPFAGSADPLATRDAQTTIGRALSTGGETVRLEAAGTGFAAIHSPAGRAKARGGIVLLHDQAGSADSDEVIRPLRLGLAEAGWDTLSLQLPTAYTGQGTAAWLAWGQEIQARTLAGLAWLKARGLDDQVIIAQGDSGIIAVALAGAGPPVEWRALVLVSTPLAGYGDEAWAALRNRDLPVLDIYAQRDRAMVVDTAAARLSIAGGDAYRQIEWPGAVAGFRGMEDGLVARVRAWLAATSGSDAP